MSLNCAAGVSGEFSGATATEAVTLDGAALPDCADFKETAFALVNKTALTAATATKLAANFWVMFMLVLLG